MFKILLRTVYFLPLTHSVSYFYFIPTYILWITLNQHFQSMLKIISQLFKKSLVQTIIFFTTYHIWVLPVLYINFKKFIGKKCAVTWIKCFRSTVRVIQDLFEIRFWTTKFLPLTQSCSNLVSGVKWSWIRFVCKK